MNQLPKILLLLLWMTFFTAIFGPSRSAAHDGRPIVFEIQQGGQSNDELNVSVKLTVPNAIDRRYKPIPLLPDDCILKQQSLVNDTGDAYQYQHDYKCKTSLSGKGVSLNYPAFNPSLSGLYRVTFSNGETFSKIITPGEDIWIIPTKSSFLNVMRDYIILGVTHILKGLDHLLFVLCLLFVAGSGKRIVTAVTGFTLAHSLTLILSTMGVINLSIGSIEALIALSIVVLAAEIIRDNKDTILWRYPITVASGFGLLHGLGFASVLAQIGLPELHKIQALLFFNIGVEIGQIIFILAMLIAAKTFQFVLSRRGSIYRVGLIKTLCLYTIGVICSYWFVEKSLDLLL